MIRRSIFIAPMNSIFLFALILSLSSAKVQPHEGPVISHAPRTYKVNVQDSPLTRWAPIISDYKQPLKKFMFYFDLLPFSKDFIKDIEWYAKNQFKYQDFVAEVDAITQLSGYPFNKLFFINFLYQVSTIRACTGVIVRTQQGKIIHGRNLDFFMWELLSNLMVNVQYYKNNQLLYTVDTVIPSVFAMTAQRPGAFSIEINTRGQRKWQQNFIDMLAKGQMPTCWLVKKVVQQETTFANAVKRLETQRIGGPVYFVVSGVKDNQGIVIERENEGVHASYSLTDSNWFIVQTNYDRNLPDPAGDERRVPAQQKMKIRGNKNITEQDLFNIVLSQYPNLNLGTIHTTVMISAEGYHNTTVWYGQNPEAHSLQTE